MIDITRILEVQKLPMKVKFCETAEYVMYHKSCFQKNSKTNQNVDEEPTNLQQDPAVGNEWKNLRHIHSAVFKQLVPYLNEKMVENRKILALSDVHNHYMRLFTEEKSLLHRESTESSLKPQHLLEKILKACTNITKIVYKNRTYLHPRNMELEEILAKGFEREDDMSTKIKAVATEIRRAINQMETRKLPKNNITVNDITKGECEVPKELYLLIENIVQGPCVQHKNQSLKREIKRNKISSICSSIIFTATNGKIKPSTCITLALSTKSLTGSRRIINILNRLGHCVSYNVAEEIETELAYACSIEHRVIPYDLNPCIHTHVAFDNYDQYVETETGKDTLHDTVGIAYQNINEMQQLSMNSLRESISNIDKNQNHPRRRKYLSPFDNKIEPYLKGNQQIPSLIGNEPTVPENVKTVAETNILWVLNHAFIKDDAKKWFAWHTERIIDQNPMQKIGYLPIINASPTSDSVVLKTMKMALELADECNQDYIIVTYDLAIASKALKIQADKHKEFDRLFINLGAFHIELSFFKVS